MNAEVDLLVAGAGPAGMAAAREPRSAPRSAGGGGGGGRGTRAVALGGGAGGGPARPPPIPEFMLLGGMMVGKEDIPRLIGRFRSAADFIYAAKLVLRYLADRLRYRRGTRLMMGNALVARLFYSLQKRGVPILFGAAITDVVGDRGGVVGARIRLGAKDVAVKTRKGV